MHVVRLCFEIATSIVRDGSVARRAPTERMIRARLATRVCEICVERNVSLESLSQRSGIRLETLRDVATGDGFDPQLSVVRSIATALGVELDAFSSDGSNAT